jgi:hypothetical protein
MSTTLPYVASTDLPAALQSAAPAADMLNAAIKPLAVRFEAPLAQIQGRDADPSLRTVDHLGRRGQAKEGGVRGRRKPLQPGWNPENVTARDRFLAEVTGRLPQR